MVRAPKHFIRLPDADHNDHDSFGAIEAVMGFLAGDVIPPRNASG
jgi:hypothetical protein